MKTRNKSEKNIVRYYPRICLKRIRKLLKKLGQVDSSRDSKRISLEFLLGVLPLYQPTTVYEKSADILKQEWRGFGVHIFSKYVLWSQCSFMAHTKQFLQS